jgi:putative addiction module killer protein
MFTVLKTEIFMNWFAGLKDDSARNKVRICIDRLEIGNFGDHHSVGDGVSELRIHYGPGYRLYYVIRGREIIILLCGGNKSSQKRDTKKAKEIKKEV